MRCLTLMMAVAFLTIGALTACQTATSQQQANNQKASPAPTAPPKQETEKEMKRISVEEAKAAFDAGNVTIVDTRSAEQYKQEHIKGAINIPSNEFEKRFKEIPTGKQIIAYCS